MREKKTCFVDRNDWVNSSHMYWGILALVLGRYMYLNLFSSLCVDSDLTRFSRWGYRKQGWFRHSLIDETHICT